MEAELYQQFLFFREAHLQQMTITDGPFAKNKVRPPENRSQNYENVCRIHARQCDAKNIETYLKRGPKVNPNPCEFQK